MPLLNLDASGASITAGWNSVKVSGVHGTLTKEPAAALNATFDVTLFKAGLPVGTATTAARGGRESAEGGRAARPGPGQARMVG